MRRDADASVALAGAVSRNVALVELRLQHVRCLSAAELALHPWVNLITGDNGAGKTSLLEAVYLLGRGRSFRTRQVEQLIRAGEEQLAVAGRLRARANTVSGSPTELRVGVQCSRSAGLEAQVDGRCVDSLAELAARFPVQVIDPGIHRLIEEGPAIRRQWLDWAMFHVEPQFLTQWRSYRRALRQRNAALRANSDPTLWDSELQRFGDALTCARTQLVEGLQPLWASTLQALELSEAASTATLTFYRGWSSSYSLAESLARGLQRDRERGMTLQGPHRFDVALRVQGAAARDTVSRGQQKLLGAAMALSMARLLGEHLGSPPTLLLDDPAAELDPRHTRQLLATAAAIGGQQIVTALRPDQTLIDAPNAMFHVERGEVKRL